MDPTNLIQKLYDLFEQVKSLEILPGGLDDWKSFDIPPEAQKPSQAFPFVLVEGHLGIPKKVIYALYLAAIARPLRFGSKPLDDQEVQDVISSSAIILIISPGHQTALHARKRLIQSSRLDVSTEMRFIELLVRGSPECAKQSIVWDHRRWCFHQSRGLHRPVSGLSRLSKHTSRTSPQFSSVYSPSDPQRSTWPSATEAELSPKITPEDIQHEWEIILATCETYPRNYHAWNHWRWLTDVIRTSIYLYHGQDDLSGCGNFVSLLLETHARQRLWVDCHPSDYTAVHYLFQTQALMDGVLSLELPLPDAGANPLPPQQSPLNHAQSLLPFYSTHETVWLYLRLALGTVDHDSRAAVIQQVLIDFSSNPFSSKLASWFSRQTT